VRRLSFRKICICLLPLLIFAPVRASADLQVQSYAEMICGTNLNTAEPEDPETKKRCVSGLVRLGRKSFQVSGSSIQKCKAQTDFLGCIRNHTSDASRIARAAREHAVEIRTMSLTPHHLKSPRLEALGQTIKQVLGPRTIFWSNNSKTFGCKGRSLYGYYNIPRGYVVMCEGFHRGDFHELVDTLKHEGWHAVQHQCRKGAPLLSEQQIASRIRREDAFNVHNYHPKQQRLESEARIIAKMNDQDWIKLVKDQCRGKNKKRFTPDLGMPYKPFYVIRSFYSKGTGMNLR